MSPDAEIDAMILRETVVIRPSFVPELAVHGAADYAAIWSATEATLEEMRLPPPFWAFAWAGGQALARYMLDAPDRVARRRVFAFGAGGGVEAIAAALAGAASVVANDIDPVARRAMALNAAMNGVALTIDGADWLTAAAPPDADILLAGDVYYERTIADRLTPLLEAALDRGAEVWIGDAGRPHQPRDGVERLASYRIPTPRALEDADALETSVLRLARRPSRP